MKDRFGLSWRGELAAGVFSNRHLIYCLEVIADDYLDSPSRLLALARHIPISLHSMQLGMSSPEGLDPLRVERLRRLIDRVKPEGWSEHLAMVRGGGVEIGHMAPAPRTPGTVRATLANLAQAGSAVGLAPAVENIATLVSPPASTMTEPEWLAAILVGCENPLLLDLHKVHANAVNFGFDAREFLNQLPLDRVGTIHIAGGRWMESRWLDDHKHPVPAEVFALLEYVAARVPQSLTVILERDGAFPAVSDLVAELDSAREVLRRDRHAPVFHVPTPIKTRRQASKRHRRWPAIQALRRRRPAGVRRATR